MEQTEDSSPVLQFGERLSATRDRKPDADCGERSGASGSCPAPRRALPKGTERRLSLALGFITVAIVGFYFLNRVVPCVDLSRNSWACPQTIPAMSYVGADFKLGVYQPAQLLRMGKSPYSMDNLYPPFVSVFGLPFTVLDQQTAYLIHAIGIVLANFASLCLAVSIAISTFASRWNDTIAPSIARSLVLALSIVQFTSYGFEFSLERGNCDAYVGLFSVLGLWVLVNRRRWLWSQVLLLSLAAHFKLYPAILLFLVLWRHRWRSILPILAINGVLLFIIGWKPVLEFEHWVAGALVVNVSTVHNHSGTSFWDVVLVPILGASPSLSIWALALPIAIWCVAAAVLCWRGSSRVNIVMLYVLSIPVMDLVPHLSHDYKLVILIVPLTIVLFDSVLTFAVDGTWRAACTIVGLMLLMGGTSRSYMVTSTVWLANKYPYVLLMQVFFLLSALVRRDSLVGRTRMRTKPMLLSGSAA